MFISERLRAAVFYTGGQARAGESEACVCVCVCARARACVMKWRGARLRDSPPQGTHQAHLVGSLLQKRSHWGCLPPGPGLAGEAGVSAGPRPAGASPIGRAAPGSAWPWWSNRTRCSGNSRIQDSPRSLASAGAVRRGNPVRRVLSLPGGCQDSTDPPPVARHHGYTDARISPSCKRPPYFWKVKWPHEDELKISCKPDGNWSKASCTVSLLIRSIYQLVYPKQIKSFLLSS